MTVTNDTQPPIVSVLVSSTLINQGESVQVQFLTDDNVSVPTATLLVNGQEVSIDPSGITTITPDAGIATIEVLVADAAGNIGRTETSVRVIDPTDTIAPVVSIDSPAIDSQVTNLTDVAISVIGDDIDTYTLEYSLRGTNNWITLTTGSIERFNEIVATFDPTLLPNDHYDLRLTAFDFSGNTATTELFVAVEGQTKIGNYALDFVDLTIPLAGIPIQITRQYDTLNANFSQDFGFGARLSIGEARIRETVPVGQAELDGVPSLFGGSGAFFAGTRIYVTTPNGQRVGFTFEPEVRAGLLGPIFSPRFVADVDTNFELEVEDIPLSQNADGTFGLYLIGGNYNPSEYTLVSTDQLRYTYDQFDELQTIQDRNGVTLEYRENGIFSSTGESIQFVRDEFDRIVEIIDPSGNLLTYQYDAAGDLVSFSDQVGLTTTFDYSDQRPHFLETVTGPRGNLINEVRYDEDGRVVSIVDALGDEVRQEYDLPNNTFVQTDAVGNVSQLSFDERGNITELVDSRGNSSFAEYNDPDNIHLETSITDPRGITTEFTYDDSGNVTRIVEVDRFTTIQYNENNDILRIEGPTPLNAGPDFVPNVVTFSYDTNGNVASFTNAEGETETFVNDSFGRALSITDARGNAIQLAYGNFSDPDVITFADGSVRTTVRDEKGLLELVTNEVGEVIDFAYDEAGRPLGVIDALGNVYQNIFEDDLLVRTIDPLGRETSFEYDAKNRLVTITDAIGGETTRTYDANNRVTSITNQLGQTQSRTYSPINEVTSITDARGEVTNFTYDAFSNLLSIEDARGFTTSFEYDDRSRLISETDAVGNVESYTYDERDNLISITERSGAISQFEYDRVSRLLGVTDALGGLQRWVYDDAGNNVLFTDELGNETTFEYDVRDRLVRQTDAAGFDQLWAYDDSNRLIQFTDQDGFDSFFEYDGNNRLVSRTDALGGVVSFGYDTVGNRTSTTDELGRVTNRSYDDLDRAIELLDASGATTSFDYDGLGNLTSLTDQLGNQTTYEYGCMSGIVVFRQLEGMNF